MKPKKINNWEKEFDEKMSRICIEILRFGGKDCKIKMKGVEPTKEFIRKFMARSYQQGVKDGIEITKSKPIYKERSSNKLK